MLFDFRVCRYKEIHLHPSLRTNVEEEDNPEYIGVSYQITDKTYSSVSNVRLW